MATYYRWRRGTIDYNEVKTYGATFHSGALGLFVKNTKPTHSGVLYNFSSYDENYPVSLNSEGIDLSGKWVSLDQGQVNYILNATGSISYDDARDRISVSGTRYNLAAQFGDFLDYVYSTESNAYPNGGAFGDYYYDQRTTVTSPTAPSGLSYPATITTPSVDVTWTAATSNTNYPVNGYQVDVSTNGGSSWTLAGNPTTNSLTYSITPGTTSIMFRVRAKDSNGQWGSYVTGTASQVLLAPTLTVPQMAMQGQSIAVNWTSIEGADSYTLQRKANTDTDWTQVYSGANTTFSEVAGTWTTVQYRVQAVFDGTPGGWATSAEIPVVSASALVISGQDGDLGVVVNDIPYSISTDTGNQITATISVNSAPIFSGNVTSGAASVIPVLDLISGEGTITIEASVQASSGTVTAVRTWTYTKTIMTFPNAGSIAELTKDGAVMWPETLANAVRLPGGKTLDQVMGFPCQIFTGSYVGTGTYGEDNPTEITFPFVPDLWWIPAYKGTDGVFYTFDYPVGPYPWGAAPLNHMRGSTSDDLQAEYNNRTVKVYDPNNPGRAEDQWNQSGYEYFFIGIKIG